MAYQYDDGFRNRAVDPTPVTEVVAPPAVCPGCKSRSISTTSRVPDQHAYWRCEACGEIWNDARRKAAPRGRNPWR
jgi:transposase-like protein